MATLTLPLTCDWGTTGITLGVTFYRTNGTVHTARFTAGIVELGSSGQYHGTKDIDTTDPPAVAVWDDGGSPTKYASEGLAQVIITAKLTAAVATIAKLEALIEADGASYRFSANALESVFLVNMANVEGSAPNDSLCTAALALATGSNTLTNPGYLTIKKTDGTAKRTLALTTDNTAVPVTGIG